MGTYVLVHGGWLGGWCWEKVAPILSRYGHRVITPDLPAHGNDPMLAKEVTLQIYTDRLCQILDATSEPVILTAHSGSGTSASQAAEMRPEKINTLVYLSGLLLQNGQSDIQVSTSESDSLLLNAVVISEDQTQMTLLEESVKPVLMNDCSDEDISGAIKRFRPEPTRPAVTPISISEENYGRVPRVYIECLQDRAITPALQKKMYTAMPCQQVLSLDTSHSPFYADPKALVDALLSLA